jgi:amino acid permease
MELLSQRRLNVVICCSISFALVIYTIVALEGYQTYGSLVRGDILLNYPENMPVTVLRICIAFMLTLHYPLQLDPGRRCISSLVKVVLKWCHQKQSNRRNLSEYFCKPELERQDSNESVEEEQSDGVYAPMEMSHGRNPQEECDDRLFYSITILFLALSFLLATIVDDLGVILALVGATGSTLVSYVLPGLMYIKVYPNKDASLVMAHVQLLLGIVIMPLALYFIVTEKLSH